jgi:serine/threonine protein kinase
MAVPLKQFVKNLEDSGILAGDTLKDFLPPRSEPKGAEELARELVRKKKLTKFQAEEVYRGKGKSLVLGNYLILDKIGAGGMGQVFKAEHRRMHRIVAVKMLPTGMMKKPEVVARFEREVRAAAKLNHPNIVTAFDADNVNGVPLLIMEYVEGTDLSALVKKNGPLPVERALYYVLQAAQGLEAAHAEGIVHRDIKPANLLLDKEGIVKILDMGLARIGGDAAGQAELTATGAVMGTVDYMAPEQALNTKTADARADIYSLGCSLFYLLTGKATYNGDTLMAKLLAHREQPIPSIRGVRPEVPEPVEAVFSRLIAKRIEDRYQTMADVIADLKSLTKGHVPPSNTQPPSDSFVDTGLTNFLNDIVLTEPKPVPPQNKTSAGPAFWKDNKKNLLIGGGVLGGLILLAGIVLSLRPKAGTPVVETNEPRADRPVRKEPRKRKIARTDDEAPSTGSSILSNDFALSPERDAARFVLSIGGEVVVNYDYGRKIKAVSALPKEAFFVANIWLMENQKVTDRDLPRFKDCQGLWMLALVGTRITDAGLAHVKEYVTAQGLSEVYIGDTSITDSGLAHLADCTGIRQLWIFNTAVTDAGLNDLKQMKQMLRLVATGTKVTDAGARQLANALPQCKIEWDGGVIEPTRAADPE